MQIAHNATGSGHYAALAQKGKRPFKILLE